jgi:ATP-dependent protease HslVU (ClpYQ) peptidase subunit
LVGDKQATEGGILQTVTKVRKITSGKHKGWLIGAAGATAQCNMMMGWFEAGADPNKFPHALQKEDGFAAHMIAISPQGVVHKYEFVPFPIIFEDTFYASGSGRDLAIGALAMGADAVRAAEVACTYCSECGVGLDVVELRTKKAPAKKARVTSGKKR